MQERVALLEAVIQYRIHRYTVDTNGWRRAQPYTMLNNFNDSRIESTPMPKPSVTSGRRSA